MTLNNSQLTFTRDEPLNKKRFTDCGGLNFGKVSVAGIGKYELRVGLNGALYYKSDNGTTVLVINPNGTIPAGNVVGTAGVSAINSPVNGVLTGAVSLVLEDMSNIDDATSPITGDTLVWNGTLNKWQFGTGSDKVFWSASIFTTPTTEWIVNHSLNKRPTWEVLNLSGQRMMADERINLVDPLNQIIVRHLKPKAGYVICS